MAVVWVHLMKCSTCKTGLEALFTAVTDAHSNISIIFNCLSCSHNDVIPFHTTTYMVESESNYQLHGGGVGSKMWSDFSRMVTKDQGNM